MIIGVDPMREVARPTTAKDQNPGAVKMWSATIATRRVTSRRIAESSKPIRWKERSLRILYGWSYNRDQSRTFFGFIR